MKKPMCISLRGGEKIYVNGAVLRVDRNGQSTAGKIMSVHIIQGGAVATLDNGVQVQLGPGITIS